MGRIKIAIPQGRRRFLEQVLHRVAWPVLPVLYFVWFLLPLFLWLVPQFFAKPVPRFESFWGAVWVIGVTGGMIATPWLGGRLARIGYNWGCREVEAAAFQLCLGCRYPLKGLGDIGRCPECGRLFSTAELREGWTMTYPHLRDLWQALDNCEARDKELSGTAEPLAAQGGTVSGSQNAAP